MEKAHVLIDERPAKEDKPFVHAHQGFLPQVFRHCTVSDVAFEVAHDRLRQFASEVLEHGLFVHTIHLHAPEVKLRPRIMQERSIVEHRLSRTRIPHSSRD